MPKRPRYLTAKQAADLLDISLESLYAYVSRGLIRSETLDSSKRTRRYLADDVFKLIERKEQRADPSKAVKKALHWGPPALDSALTLITEDNVYYCGYSALELAKTRTLEEVSALLWLGDFSAANTLYGSNFHSAESENGGTDFSLGTKNLELGTPNSELITQFQILLALAAADDAQAFDFQPSNVARIGARILRLLAAAVGNGQQEQTAARTLAHAWNAPERLLNAALVLCADHELNASSFAARVAASADASPYAVVTAGLAVLQGLKHGGSVQRAEAFLCELRDVSEVRARVNEKLQLGERIPGFGHRLYPDADPRAVCLFEMLREHAPDTPALQITDALIAEMRELKDIAPNIDLALATLSLLLNLPRGSGMALFALGRVVGWIGHAIEQYAQGELIRPRARYVGQMPR